MVLTPIKVILSKDYPMERALIPGRQANRIRDNGEKAKEMVQESIHFLIRGKTVPSPESGKTIPIKDVNRQSPGLFTSPALTAIDLKKQQVSEEEFLSVYIRMESGIPAFQIL